MHFWSRESNQVKSRQETYVKNVIFEARSCNYCCREKAINIKNSECVSLALFTQHAKRIRRITRVETLIVATIDLQLIQNRYMFRSFTVLQFSHQHCVQPVASDVEVVGYL